MQNTESEELPHKIKQHITRHQAPPGLGRRIRYAIDASAEARVKDDVEAYHLTAKAMAPSDKLPHWLSVWTRQWLSLSVGAACGALMTFGFLYFQKTDHAAQQFQQQLVSSHVHSLLVTHKTDVQSTDQHTVKPWFIGKLDYAPVVIDLSSEGFPLVGGRLDYMDGRTIAALVYARNQHLINLYVWPKGEVQKLHPGSYSKQGYNLIGWTQANMQFWAVTDASEKELRQFMGAIELANAAKN
jgi:anti-sigma factor RsiW